MIKFVSKVFHQSTVPSYGFSAKPHIHVFRFIVHIKIVLIWKKNNNEIIFLPQIWNALNVPFNRELRSWLAQIPSSGDRTLMWSQVDVDVIHEFNCDRLHHKMFIFNDPNAKWISLIIIIDICYFETNEKLEKFWKE